MHPDIVSGMGIAENHPLGNNSSLFINEIMQFLLKQVIEYIFD